MNKLTKLTLLLTLILVLSQSVMASTMNVTLTTSNQLSLEVHSDSIGWQNSKLEIFNQRGVLVYNYEDLVYYSIGPVFQLVDLNDSKPGIYDVVLTLENETLEDSFSIQRNRYDWFWLISLLLVLGLAIVAKKSLLGHDSKLEKSVPKEEKKDKKTSKQDSQKKV